METVSRTPSSNRHETGESPFSEMAPISTKFNLVVPSGDPHGSAPSGTHLETETEHMVSGRPVSGEEGAGPPREEGVMSNGSKGEEELEPFWQSSRSSPGSGSFEVVRS